jgi:micrococcal nuclease
MIKDNYVRKVVSIERIVDGDTAYLWIDKGDAEHKRYEIRFLGVNTPERGQDGYYEAKGHVHNALMEADRIDVQTVKHDVTGFEQGGFGRYLGIIYLTKNGIQYDLNAELLELGLAKVYVKR